MMTVDAKMHTDMRTTVTLDDELYRRAKAAAARTGRTVGAIIEDALRRELDRPAPAVDLEPLPTFGGSGVMAGIDLTSNAALLEAMEAGESLDAHR